MTLTSADLEALAVSLRLASVTVVCLLMLGTPLAWWLARSRHRLKALVEGVVALPLVLPPSVLGFYLLLMLGAEGPLGKLSMALGTGPLAFSFTGLVLGSIVYSLPFVVQPLQNAFSAIDSRLLEAAATLGAGPLDRFLTVVLPASKAGWIRAAALGFAHTLGEFGVVLMIGGNLPGQTRVASVAIYNHVEAMDYARGHQLAATLLVLSLALMVIVHLVAREPRRQGSR